MKKYAIYIRVSTHKQGASGLGLESQQKICNDFIAANNGEKVAEFKDVESGTHRDRKGLLDAVEYCKRNDVALVIAKLDRLARDVEFCFKVVNTGIEIHFCDMPSINTLLLGVFAAVAQYERELTSDRTTKALAQKKARGEATGGATDKWRDAYNAKSKEQKSKENSMRGSTKNSRHLQSKEVQVFIKVLRNVFPAATQSGNLIEWDWSQITTKNGIRQKVLGLMRDYRDLDPTLWRKWPLDDLDYWKLQAKLGAHIQALRNAVFTQSRYNEQQNKN